MNSIHLLFSSPGSQRPKKLFRFQTQAIIALATLMILVLVPTGTQAQEMKLLTPTTGWVSRFNHLYWTTDSGSNWADITPVPLGVVRAGIKIRSVYFLNTEDGWAVVSHPETVVPTTPQALRNRKTFYQIAQTVDGGQSWSFLPLTYPELSPDEEAGLSGPGDMFFLDSLHGWLVMAFDGNSEPGRLLVTDDGGKNWTWQHGVGFSGTIRFTSLEDGWFLGGPYDQLFATHDGGATWQEIHLPAPPQVGAATDATFQDLPAFSNSKDGFVAVHFSGRGSTATKLVIYSTPDAGKTWRPAKVLPERRAFWQGVRFPFAIADSMLLIATGSKTVGVGRIPLTGQMESDVAASRSGVLALSFADTSAGWALSVEGRLLATADAGVTWKEITPWHVSTPASTLSVPPVNHPQIQIEVTDSGASQLSGTLAAPSGGQSNLHPSVHLGFDRSDVLQPGDMGNWWKYSPYYDVYIYLPGSPNRHVDSNLTSNWVSTIEGQGWGLIPIWFGMQPPCLINGDPSITDFIDPANAAQEGTDEANAAASEAAALGLSKTIIYKDMENFYTDSNHTACDDAVKAYTSAWDSTLQSLGYKAGVYANPMPVQLEIGYVSPPPNDIWISHYDNKATIFDPTAGWDNLWPAGQRSRQYIKQITETYDALTFGIDRDIEDAPVAGGNGTKSYTYSNFQALNLGYDLTYAYGINDANQGVNGGLGQIAGYGYTSNAIGYLLDQDSGRTDISNNADTVASRVNNPEQVVGFSGPSTGVGVQQGFLYDKSTNSYSTIDYLGGGAVSSAALGVNDDVQIVGWYYDGSGNYHGFLDDGGNFSSIDNSATHTEADEVNGVGQVVGYYADSRGQNHAFLYQNGQIVKTYDCKGASDTYFSGINNNQLVTGMCVLNGVFAGFVYDYGHDQLITTFSFPGSTTTLGEGVNDSGQIVGVWADAGDISRAYYATPTPGP